MKTFIGVKLYLDLKYFETVGTLVCIQYRGRRGQVLARYSHWDHDDLQTIPMLLGMGRLGKRSSCFRTTSLLKGGRLGEKEVYGTQKRLSTLLRKENDLVQETHDARALITAPIT